MRPATLLAAAAALLLLFVLVTGQSGPGPATADRDPSAAASPASADPGSRAARRVALTFDDLPMTGNPVCDSELARRVTRALTDTLEERSLPAAGLATPGQSCLTPELRAETYRRWREVGALIGNHTATHPDFNRTSIERYLSDIDRGQELIDAALGAPQEERWFRPPMLHSGDTAAKKRALADHLEARGYRVAPVTVDNQEWVYGAVYAEARQRGDRPLADRVVEGYMEHMEASMEFYEDLSEAVFDRQIPQVLLLHANLLNAEHLDRVVGMLEERGYSFVSLPEALADPAYQREDTYVGSQGLSWLQRWAMAEGLEVPPEPREAEWVAAARREAGDRSTADDDRSRILAASTAFSRAYMEGDTAAIRALYTEDAVLLPPERVVRGREAIGRYFTARPGRRNLAHAMRPDDLRIDGDVAVDTGIWTNTWQVGDEEPQSAEGQYLVVWRRGADGRWRIEYDMWHRPAG